MLKTAIVDDHKLFRSSLKLMIGSFGGIDVVFDAENGKDLLQKLKFHVIDVVLLDLQMPEMDGFETCTILHRLYPSLKILALSHLSDRENIQKILDCGAHGYLTKNAGHEQLNRAILDIYKNGYYFDDEISAVLHDMIVHDKKCHTPPADPLEHLSERDLLLIRLVARGYSNTQIAERLFVTVRTVEAHRTRIMEKTETRNFMGVVLKGVKFGYLTGEDF